MPSGVYKHKPAPKNHPWRKEILAMVIEANNKTKEQRDEDNRIIERYLKGEQI